MTDKSDGTLAAWLLATERRPFGETHTWHMAFAELRVGLIFAFVRGIDLDLPWPDEPSADRSAVRRDLAAADAGRTALGGVSQVARPGR